MIPPGAEALGLLLFLDPHSAEVPVFCAHTSPWPISILLHVGGWSVSWHGFWGDTVQSLRFILAPGWGQNGGNKAKSCLKMEGGEYKGSQGRAGTTALEATTST